VRSFQFASKGPINGAVIDMLVSPAFCSGSAASIAGTFALLIGSLTREA
jgi:hypothetical protein